MQSLKPNSNLILLATLFFIILGVFQAINLPVSLYPKVEKPIIKVVVTILDDSESFYHQWGKKIEQSLRSIEDVENVEATYQQGRATIMVRFEWNITPKAAKQAVSTITSFYQGQLPSEWPAIRIGFLDHGSENYAAIVSDKYTAGELSEMLKLNLLPKLEAIEGVTAAWISDKDKRYLLVEARPYDLLNHNIEMTELQNALTNHAYNLKLGLLQTSDKGKLTVTVSKRISDIAIIKNITVKSTSSVAIKLSDVADVRWATEPNARTLLYDDNEVVAIAVWPEPDANIYDTSQAFLAQLEEFSNDVGDVLILNSPIDFIKEAIANILFALCLGMLTAALVVFFFYRRITNTLIICASMPIALCISMLVMSITNVGVNLISLGAMSIAIGMVVDGAIIVMDRINQKIQKHDQPLSFSNKLTCISDSVREVKPSIISSTLTSIIVFLPLVFTAPFIASILQDMVLVTIAILCSSIFLSLVVLPCVYVFLLRHRSQVFENRSANQQSSKGLMESMHQIEQALVFLTKTSRRKNWVLTSAVATCSLVIIFITPNIRQEIIAQPRAEIIDIGVSFDSEGLESVQKLAIIEPIKTKIYDLVGKNIEYIYSDLRPSQAYLSLHLNSYRDFDHVFDTLNKAVSDNKLENLTVDPWITSSLNIKEIPAVEMFFNDANRELNRKYLKSTLDFLKKHPLVKRVKGTPKASLSEVVHMDLNEANIDLLLSGKDYEAYSSKLNRFVKYALEPQKLFDLNIGSGLKDLKLKVKTETSDLKGILSLPYEVSNKEVFIDQLYQTRTQKVWRDFFSSNARESYRAEVWSVRGASRAQTKSLQDEIKHHLKETFNLSMLPVSFKDSGAETRVALSSVKNSLLFSVALVFLVLLYQFKRIQVAAIVISVVPFGICGALVALFVFDSTLSLNSVFGMLIVSGLSVNNSIILVDEFKKNFVQGYSQIESIVKSIHGRLRALTVTNLTTIGGMLPLSIGLGPGQDIIQPLGISVSFGLIFAIFGSLVVVPVLLSYSSVVKNEEYDSTSNETMEPSKQPARA